MDKMHKDKEVTFDDLHIEDTAENSENSLKNKE
jgi:hypothetical protein